MVEVEHGTLLGKCTIDGQPIYEGTGMRSKQSTIINGKWISGDILLKLYPQCFEAFMEEHKSEDIKRKNLLKNLREYGWHVNAETGKLQKL